MRERIRFEKEIEFLELPREYETLIAGKSERIDRLLGQKKNLPQWRILALLKCGAVELTRGGTKRILTNENDAVRKGDLIELKSPLPQQCEKAIANIPETDYRDYAFANPRPADEYEKWVVKYVQLRPQTKILSNSSVDSLASFIKELKNGQRLTHPIRHLIVASHASRTGRLALKLQTNSSLRVITYEDLETTLRSKMVDIDSKLLEPRPKNASGRIIAAQLHIKGCNIGNPIAMPFLELMKKALGSKVGLTAPKFFHSLKIVFEIKKGKKRIISRKPIEIWEFLSYEFVLYRLTKLIGKADAVGAFKASPSFERIDRSTVTQKDWERSIPSTLPGENKMAKVDVAITSTLSNKAHNVDAQFRYRKTFFLGREWHNIGLAKDPGTDTLRKEEIKRRLVSQDNRFQATHPYPFYARTGFKSIDDYFDSYSWKFKPFNTKRRQLSFSGVRHEYTVLAPIVDPKTGELFMNLFPISGSPTIRITESDSRFFTSV